MKEAKIDDEKWKGKSNRIIDVNCISIHLREKQRRNTQNRTLFVLSQKGIF